MIRKNKQRSPLTPFEPGNGRNTILRLAANALGIPLIDPETGQQEKPFDAMPDRGQAATVPEWTRILNPGGASTQAESQDNELENKQDPFKSYQEMKDNVDIPKNIDQTLVLRGLMDLPISPRLTMKQEFSQLPYSYDEYTGRMNRDIDGRTIHPDAVIVGRKFYDRDNIPLSDSDADDIIKKITGKDVIYMNPGRDDSYAVYNDKYKGIGINNSIDKELQMRAKRHEMGHMFDDFGGTIYEDINKVPEDVLTEFRKIYNEQRNPYLGFERLRNPQEKAQDVLYGSEVSPTMYGYPKSHTRPELFAEAMRAYLTNPNTMKAQFPRAAKYLRNYINLNPNFNKYIHLSDNSGNINAEPYFPFAKQNKNT